VEATGVEKRDAHCFRVVQKGSFFSNQLSEETPGVVLELPLVFLVSGSSFGVVGGSGLC